MGHAETTIPVDRTGNAAATVRQSRRSESLTPDHLEFHAMFPEGDPDSDGLTREQFRWLLGFSLAVGFVFLLLVLGITAASHLYGVGGGQSGPPEAVFTVQTQAAADGVAANVTHRGIEAADPGDLLVSVDNETVGNWSSLGGQGPGLVATGHTLLLRAVEPGDVVRIHWVGDGEQVVLARETVNAEPVRETDTVPAAIHPGVAPSERLPDRDPSSLVRDGSARGRIV